MVEAMRRDKKVVDGRLHYVLATAIGEHAVVDDVTEAELAEALRPRGFPLNPRPSQSSIVNSQVPHLLQQRLVAHLQQIGGARLLAARLGQRGDHFPPLDLRQHAPRRIGQAARQIDAGPGIDARLGGAGRRETSGSGGADESCRRRSG